MASVNSTKQNIQSSVWTKPRGTAWPTLFLFACGYALWFWAWMGAWNKFLPSAVVVALACAGQFLLYTCLHEAVHVAISRRRWLNGLVGRLAAMSLFAPYRGFCFVHLEHHRFVNNPKRDPDVWSAKSFLLLRWFSQDFYYYRVLMKAFRKHSLRSVANMAFQMTLNIGIVVWLVTVGRGEVALFAWILPAKLTIAWLCYIFNYLPHHPHDEKLQDTVFKKTSARPNPWLTPVFLGQNFHNIHHLYPAARFYDYGKIWRLEKERLIALGTPVH